MFHQASWHLSSQAMQWPSELVCFTKPLGARSRQSNVCVCVCVCVCVSGLLAMSLLEPTACVVGLSLCVYLLRNGWRHATSRTPPVGCRTHGRERFKVRVPHHPACWFPLSRPWRMHLLALPENGGASPLPSRRQDNAASKSCSFSGVHDMGIQHCFDSPNQY